MVTSSSGKCRVSVSRSLVGREIHVTLDWANLRDTRNARCRPAQEGQMKLVRQKAEVFASMTGKEGESRSFAVEGSQ